MNDKNVIQRNFSRFARHYQAFSDIQTRSAERLIELTPAFCPETILDIGCGPGNYTSLLKERFPDAKITAVDISEGMIDVARGRLGQMDINFIVADGETLELTQKFDLITSNASFQWFDDLAAGLKRYKGMLTESGNILFSIFGPGTFAELNQCLSELYGTDLSLSSSSFASLETLNECLMKVSGSSFIREEIIHKDYRSLWDLLKAIKYTGTRGEGLRGQTLTRKKIGELEDIYKNKFGSITVTYQIFYCGAERTGR